MVYLYKQLKKCASSSKTISLWTSKALLNQASLKMIFTSVSGISKIEASTESAEVLSRWRKKKNVSQFSVSRLLSKI